MSYRVPSVLDARAAMTWCRHRVCGSTACSHPVRRQEEVTSGFLLAAMQAAPAAHANNVFSRAQEPLRQYALLHLTAELLAHLRGVSKSAQQLVDGHTGSIWRAAAMGLLNTACLPDSDHASTVQCTLREQGALLKNFRAGMTLPCMSRHMGWEGGSEACMVLAWITARTASVWGEG